MGDAGCISYTFPFINLPHFLSALLALSSAARLYLRVPVCKSLLRGYNNPWERFCWLTGVKGHCSPGIKLDQPEALLEGGAHHQQPSGEDVLQTQLPWGGSQAGSCLPASSCTTQASVTLCSPLSSWHGHGLSGAGGRYLEATGCDHIAHFAFMPGTLTSSYLESSAYPHCKRCRAGSSYCLGIKCPSTFAIGSRSKTRKEKNWLISESQLPPPPSYTSRDQNQAILYF